ncbi:MAG: hypothetical protein EA399_07775 [Desulfovibrionales bacterium]|nr:MAG: hypothetical protein EA399_07775 [Desulfovibrionales bacterium]
MGHDPHPNADPEFAQAWAEANPEPQDDPPKSDEEVLDWLLFSPESLEHQDIRDRVFQWAWDMRDAADQDAAIFLDRLLDALRQDKPGQLAEIRKDAHQLKPTLGRLRALQKSKETSAP